MKMRKKVIAAVLTVAVTAAALPQSTAYKTAAGTQAGISQKAYSLSKKAGTYTKKIKITLRAKNGYRVYYSKNGSLTKSNVLKSGQSKTFTISKTSTLTLYPSKTAMTAKQLKTAKVKKASVKYVYKIKTKTADTAQDAGTGTSQTDNMASDSTSTGSAASSSTGDPQAAQNTAVAAVKKAAAQEAAAAQANAAAKAPTDVTADVPVITCSNTNADVSNLKDDTCVAVDTDNGMCTVTIKKAGTYLFTGGSESSPAKNIVVSVGKDIADDVNLVLDSLHIDNSALGKSSAQDQPVICVEKGTKNVTVTLVGASSLTGNKTFAKEPASGIIYAKDSDAVLTMLAKNSSAKLSITDPADPAAYGSLDPSDGISSKGTLVLQSGIYEISVNGDCLKGSGSDGEGGIMVLDGTYQLTSMLGNGMKSKNGSIFVFYGNIDIAYTSQDGIQAKNYDVNILGGDTTIDKCCGDGIQGENVLICGDDTKLSITTVFADAGTNYYNTQLGSGNYNTLVKTNTTKTETIHVDTGSHKGIKAGTKACTYTYQSVEPESDKEAGKTYTSNASGSITITGGQIRVDTSATGIKYNGSARTGSASGNLAPADNDGQYMIGAPDDAVHSNHDFLMTGGTLELVSADDGITAQDSLLILDNSVIDIQDSYEGIEGGSIIVGSTTENAPRITIASNDDGVNAASNAALHYDYTDESEETCTKIKTASSDNTFYMLDGYLTVMIADGQTHTFSLPTAGGGVTDGSFTANGDGIDCNGSFYAYGGTVIVYGTTSHDNSPIDTDAAYYVGSGVTILATGSGGMAENPTGLEQAAVICGGRSGGRTPDGGNGAGMVPPDTGNGNGGMAPPNQGMPGGGKLDGNSLSVSAQTPVAVLDSNGNAVVAFQAPKSFGYLFYTSPELAAGSTYTICSDGSLDGVLVDSESRYDYRYTGYQKENAKELASVTAGN